MAKKKKLSDKEKVRIINRVLGDQPRSKLLIASFLLVFAVVGGTYMAFRSSASVNNLSAKQLTPQGPATFDKDCRNGQDCMDIVKLDTTNAGIMATFTTDFNADKSVTGCVRASAPIENRLAPTMRLLMSTWSSTVATPSKNLTVMQSNSYADYCTTQIIPAGQQTVYLVSQYGSAGSGDLFVSGAKLSY